MTMNVVQAMEWASEWLISANPKTDKNSVRTDVEFLLSHCLDKSLTWLKTWPEALLSSNEEQQFKLYVERRTKGEPIAYITGSKAFWSLELLTNNATLIPRAETELLVELALEELSAKSSARVLDLGTGTGAIALSIGSERPNDFVLASDFNERAVKLAQKNAKANRVANVKVVHSDWFKNINEIKFDLIVSNPPYVASNDPHLNQGDLVFEPNSALVATGNGLDDIRHIVEKSKDFLKDNCVLMLEHGFEQGELVRDIFLNNGYQSVKTTQDLAGLDRVTQGRWNDVK